MNDMLDRQQALFRISSNVRRFLEKRGMSQSELAKLTGETNATISNTVRGVHIPNALLLARMAEALDVTADMILAEPPQQPLSTVA